MKVSELEEQFSDSEPKLVVPIYRIGLVVQSISRSNSKSGVGQMPENREG